MKKKKLVDIVVEEGILSKEQLTNLLEKQKVVKKPLSRMLIEAGFINEEKLSLIFTKHAAKILIGDLLVQMELISEEKLQSALKNDIRPDERLGDLLIRKHLINENDFISVIRLQLGIPRIEPSKEILDFSLILRSNEKFLRKNYIIPAFKSKNILTCIIADPFDYNILNALAATFKCKATPAIASKSEILNALTLVFSTTKLKESNINLQETRELMSKKDLIIDNTTRKEDDNVIVSILNYLISDAIKDRASDIHIENRPALLVVRNRIDGILHHKTDLPKHIALPLVSRIKALCEIDIAQKRIPQDGKIVLKFGNKEIDLRIATYPAEYGENVTIRILDRQSVLVDLPKLGLNPEHFKKFKKIIDSPSGLILVTGPTGSGKTTTLYSSLNYLKGKTKKIVTVEDPIEYTLAGITQGQYDRKVGVTYEEFLKSMLRQDPDVIMVGEIRDRAAAAATVQAALTGHKVLTTFHTDDTTGALLRLMDMGIETFLISSTVICVIAQRLIRCNCRHCLESYIPSRETLESFSIRDSKKYKFVHGRGCKMCKNLGYQYRIGIFEVLPLNALIRDAILARKTSLEIRKLARDTVGILSLMEDGLYKALKGISTLEEVLRVVHMEEFNRTPEEIISLCEDKATPPSFEPPPTPQKIKDSESQSLSLFFTDMNIDFKH